MGFFKRIVGITLFPFIVLREKHKNKKSIIKHELIHVEQQKELLIIFFYVWNLLDIVY